MKELLTLIVSPLVFYTLLFFLWVFVLSIGIKGLNHLVQNDIIPAKFGINLLFGFMIGVGLFVLPSIKLAFTTFVVDTYYHSELTISNENLVEGSGELENFLIQLNQTEVIVVDYKNQDVEFEALKNRYINIPIEWGGLEVKVSKGFVEELLSTKVQYRFQG